MNFFLNIYLYCSITNDAERSQQDSNLSTDEILFNIKRYIDFIIDEQKRNTVIQNYTINNINLTQHYTHSIFFYGEHTNQTQRDKIYGLYEYLKLLMQYDYSKDVDVNNILNVNNRLYEYGILISKCNLIDLEYKTKEIITNIIEAVQYSIIYLIFNTIYNDLKSSNTSQNVTVNYDTKDRLDILQKQQVNDKITLKDYDNLKIKIRDLIIIQTQNSGLCGEISFDIFSVKINNNYNDVRQLINQLDYYIKNHHSTIEICVPDTYIQTKQLLSNYLSHQKSLLPKQQVTHTTINNTFSKNNKKPLLICGILIIIIGSSFAVYMK
jgi:hypothetical protein